MMRWGSTWQAAKDVQVLFLTVQLRQEVSSSSFLFEVKHRKDLHRLDFSHSRSAGLTIWTYVKDGELVSYAVEGSGDEDFEDFPEGWNHDFGADRYEKFANWQDAGYIDPDSLSVTDCGTPFEAGLNASIVGTLDDYVADMKYVDSWKAAGDGGCRTGLLCIRRFDP